VFGELDPFAAFFDELELDLNGTSGDYAFASREDLFADDAFQDGGFSDWLGSYYYDLGEFEFVGEVGLVEDVVDLVDQGD